VIDLRSLRTKLEALRRMTVENGCTEAEAASAAGRMAEILAKHGLTETDLDAMAMAEHRAKILKKRSPIEQVWSVVADFAGCTLYFDSTVNSGRQAVYFGREPDVMVAEYVHDVLAYAIDQARSTFRRAPEYRRRRTPRTKAAALRAFEEGLAGRLCRSLWDGLWRRHGKEAGAVVDRRRGELDAALGKQVTLVQTRPLKGAGREFSEARIAGFRAGAAITVEAAVGTATTPVTGLLR
jgi:hypothetical protein